MGETVGTLLFRFGIISGGPSAITYQVEANLPGAQPDR